jgi:hypothetical protein
MTDGIKDKVVVITGASSGLGEAAARRLARDGAKLVLGARRLDRLKAIADELDLGADAVVETDVTQVDQVKHLVDHAVRLHGRIDVIINNAGLMPHSPLERGKVDDWDRMIGWGRHQRQLPVRRAHRRDQPADPACCRRDQEHADDLRPRRRAGNEPAACFGRATPGRRRLPALSSTIMLAAAISTTQSTSAHP